MSQKGFTPILILVVVLVIVAAGGGAYYLGRSATKSQDPIVTQAPQPVVQATSTPDETVNWKIYSNQSMGISFKYPSDKNFQEYPDSDGKSITIGIPDSDYGFYLSVFDNPQKLSIKDWIKANFNLLYPNVEINNKKLAFNDLVITGKQVFDQQGVEVNFGGPSPDNFFPDPKGVKLYKLTTNLNQDILNRILSTFKFLP